MKVAYVVYNERPASGLMRTQVIALVKRIRRRAPDIALDVIAIWQPWVMRRHAAQIAAMRAELAQAGIRQVDLPWALIPTRHFAYKAWLFPLLRAWVSLILRVALRGRYDVVHCRGYLPSYGAARARRALGHRVIFDMRSLWPKEHVTIGAWKADDAIHRQWERLEAFTVRESVASIGVSPAMVEQIRQLEPRGNAVHVPICADLDEMEFDAAARERLRESLGWQGRRVIVYQGSLGLMNTNLAEVAEYLAPIARGQPEVRFLVLTSNTSADVAAVLQRFGIRAEQFAVRSPPRAELASWLAVGDAGIHAMTEGPDSATRLGVKVVEYLACSLPLLVNPFVGAAADLVRAHGVGVVLDTRDPEELRSRLDAFMARNPVPFASARRLAAERFSLDAIADSYIALYRGAAAAQVAP